ncbi:ArsC/Spx/MgsR family protein [Bacillus sp. FJAT-50079]|uniref:ArsC/Spx/MgsR family protein n=1 Tax=Bacillus sp. FJAT-50079 TaxID=2833577 RepID=UPI001BCA1F10|nr:ArsC/Spx/MgsR family protein [Bacillus sp. FJAT-50079]MBS4206619.1 hypothetical protein [Bacillus sp. FJAT-50079]
MSWTMYGSRGNPSSEITRKWLKNNDLPFEEKSIYRITKEEIERIDKLLEGGIQSAVYPDVFSYLLVNPNRGKEKEGINQIQNNKISKDEMIDLLEVHPFLLMTPILIKGEGEQVIVGYDYDLLSKVFKNTVTNEHIHNGLRKLITQ